MSKTDTTISIQWKNTDACLDFTCTCGQYFHHDGFFANAFICGACGGRWLVPWLLPVRGVEPGHDGLTFERWEVDDND